MNPNFATEKISSEGTSPSKLLHKIFPRLRRESVSIAKLGLNLEQCCVAPRIPPGKNFLVWLSHDVDRVRRHFFHALKYLLRDKEIRQLTSFLSGRNPYWNFEKIMKLEEKYQVKSTFYFLQETIPLNPFDRKSYPLALGRYKIDDPEITRVIRLLDQGGWEVGLHGSYNSFRNFNLLKQEKELLEDILGHAVVGIRQHYLNLDIPLTWQMHRRLGLKYDASFGLSKTIGYRENIYYPFRPFGDDFIVFPLTIMDGPLFAKSNPKEDIWQHCVQLIQFTQEKKGILSLLWHQQVFDSLEFAGFKEIYERIIEECRKRGALFVTGHDIMRYL